MLRQVTIFLMVFLLAFQAYAVETKGIIEKGELATEAELTEPEIPDQKGAFELKLPDKIDENKMKENVDSALPDDAYSKREKLPETPEPSRFLWGNFFLGALGGALLGVGIGFLDVVEGGDFDEEKANQVLPLAAGIGALGGGIVGLLLGATTQTPARPPSSLIPPDFEGQKLVSRKNLGITVRIKF